MPTKVDYALCHQKGMEMPFYRAEDTLNPFYWWFETQDMFDKMFSGKVLKPLSSYYVCSSCTYYFTTVYCFSGTRITWLDDMDHYLSRRSRTQFIRLNWIYSSHQKTQRCLFENHVRLQVLRAFENLSVILWKLVRVSSAARESVSSL